MINAIRVWLHCLVRTFSGNHKHCVFMNESGNLHHFCLCGYQRATVDELLNITITYGDQDRCVKILDDGSRCTEKVAGDTWFCWTHSNPEILEDDGEYE